MNGKQSKRLRRIALGLSATMSESGKEIAKDGYSVKVINNKLGDENNGVKKQIFVRTDSLKGIYKQLKNGKV